MPIPAPRSRLLAGCAVANLGATILNTMAQIRNAIVRIVASQLAFYPAGTAWRWKLPYPPRNRYEIRFGSPLVCGDLDDLSILCDQLNVDHFASLFPNVEKP